MKNLILAAAAALSLAATPALAFGGHAGGGHFAGHFGGWHGGAYVHPGYGWHRGYGWRGAGIGLGLGLGLAGAGLAYGAYTYCQDPAWAATHPYCGY